MRSCQAGGLDDLRFNFLIGGAGGYVFEGRGFDAVGQSTIGEFYLKVFINDVIHGGFVRVSRKILVDFDGFIGVFLNLFGFATH